MSINEVEKIADLVHFTDQEILESIKFKCIEDIDTLNNLIYKISIGKLIFTIDILPSDKDSIIDAGTKRKLARGAAEFLIGWIRKKNKIKRKCNFFAGN